MRCMHYESEASWTKMENQVESGDFLPLGTHIGIENVHSMFYPRYVRFPNEEQNMYVFKMDMYVLYRVI